VVATDHEIARAIAGAHRELARCLGGLSEQELRVEVHGAVVVDGLPGVAKQLERLLVVELDADLLAEPLPPGVDRGECVRRQRLIAGHGVCQHGNLNTTCNLTCRLLPRVRRGAWSESA